MNSASLLYRPFSSFLAQDSLKRFLPYALAIAATALATAARWLLAPWLDPHIPFETYLPAILCAGLYG